MHIFSGRMFQIGYVTRDIDKSIIDIQNTTKSEIVTVKKNYLSGDGRAGPIRHIAYLSCGDIEIEVVEPDRSVSSIYVDDFSETVAHHIHHIGYIFPTREELGAAIDNIKMQGFDLSVYAETARADYAYIDTRIILGHYCEFVFRHSLTQR